MTRESLILIVLLVVGLLLPACQGKLRDDEPIVWDNSPTDRPQSEKDKVTGQDGRRSP